MRTQPLLAIVVSAALGLTLAGCSGESGGNDAKRVPPPSPGSEGLSVGIQDDQLAHPTTDPAPRMKTIAGLGAKVVRLDLRWDLVAKARPHKATDPADPAYDWSHYDRVVEAARAHGITLEPTIYGTPAWAADTSPAATDAKDFPTAPFGARPANPQDAGDFAQAAAARYAPKGVHMWEAWNEPNGPLFLRPQWRREGSRWVPESPRTYSQILKAMYAGIKKSDPSAVVAGGVTAPVGDLTGGRCPFILENCRVAPQLFIKELNAPDLRPPMDAYAHHPYPIRPPTDTTAPGVNYIDLYNMPSLERALDAGYLKGTPVWITEFGIATAWTASQPYFRTPQLQAQYLTDAITRVHKDPRVKMFIWYFLQDNPDWKSGLYDEAGKAKLAANAFTAAAKGG